MLANSLGNLTKLKKLTLNSNPNIGDEGILNIIETFFSVILMQKRRYLFSKRNCLSIQNPNSVCVALRPHCSVSDSTLDISS